MKHIIVFLILLTVGVLNAQANKQVFINNKLLSYDQISSIKTLYGVQPIPGEYWYDTHTGIFGLENGPALGVMYPGHEFGALQANASNGNSGVFVNNRELQSYEANQVARLFGYPAAVPGRYWMQANGNIGIEGSAIALGNVYVAIANISGGGKSGSNLWSRGLYSGGNYYTGANGQPSVGYVSVPGYGPISHGMP